MRNALLSALVLGGSVAAQNTLTSSADVAKAAATAKSESPVSHVKGKAFDRIAIIWLENTDYTDALNDGEPYFLNPGLRSLVGLVRLIQDSQPSILCEARHPSYPELCCNPPKRAQLYGCRWRRLLRM